MGPTGVLGPAGSFVSLVGTVLSLSNELMSLADGVRAAKGEIQEFANMLSTFSFAVERACDCLHGHYSSDTELDTLMAANENNFLKSADRSARGILRRVDQISPRILSIDSWGNKLDWISKVRWYLKKPEVRDLMLGMSALQNSLSLVMSTVNYEVQRQQPGIDPKILAIAMAQISILIKGGGVIASKVDRLARSQHNTDKSVQTLSALMHSVIGVADHQMEVADAAREATGEYEKGRWVKIKDPVPDQRRRKPKIQSKVRHASHQPPLRSNEAMPIQIPTGHQRKGKGRQRDRRPTEASSSRGLQDPLESNRPSSYNANGSPDTGLSTAATGDFMTHFFHGDTGREFSVPNASDEYEEVDGIITRGMGRNAEALSPTITARLYPNYSMNTISQAYVEKLGLHINHSINFSNIARVNRTVGEVEFAWHTHSHLTLVTCTVFEREIIKGVPLTLGEAYKHQTRRSGRVVDGESSRTVEGS